MTDDKQQELMYKLEMFEQQIQQLQQQLQAVEQGIVELGNLNFGLDELEGGKGKEIMSPIGQGIFAKTKLLSEDLIVDVGGKNFVKKTIPETKDLIENQIKKLDEIKKDLQNSINEIGKEFEKNLRSEIEKK